MPVSRDIRLARFLKRYGIRYPYRTIRASRKAKISLATACAILDQESNGGHNVFGHDPVRSGQIKGGEVTRGRYLRYKRLRKAGYGMQGVGPCQLTWWEFQNAADSIGGCWRPYYNMLTGFRDLKKMFNRTGSIWSALKAYNGTGAAATNYANQVSTRRKHWKARLRKFK